MGSDRIQKPSMLRMFRCDPTSFMRSISWRNCRFSSSPAFSKQKRESMNKRISVEISQENNIERVCALKCVTMQRKWWWRAYWLSSSLRQKRPCIAEEQEHSGPAWSYNLGQNKWKNKTPPPPLPKIKDGKMARFKPFARLHPWFGEGRGGWGFAVQFYFLQNCSLLHSRFSVVTQRSSPLGLVWSTSWIDF